MGETSKKAPTLEAAFAQWIESFAMSSRTPHTKLQDMSVHIINQRWCENCGLLRMVPEKRMRGKFLPKMEARDRTVRGLFAPDFFSFADFFSWALDLSTSKYPSPLANAATTTHGPADVWSWLSTLLVQGLTGGPCELTSNEGTSRTRPPCGPVRRAFFMNFPRTFKEVIIRCRPQVSDHS